MRSFPVQHRARLGQAARLWRLLGRGLRLSYEYAAFYGFLLCFASTSTATFYHYLVGRDAPYAWWDLPVVLGTLGGVGLVVGWVTVRLRQRLARSQGALGRGLLALLSRDQLDEDTWTDVEDTLLTADIGVGPTTELVERHFIEAALDLTRDNRTAAAELLGLSRQSLYLKLRRHRLLPTEPADADASG